MKLWFTTCLMLFSCVGLGAYAQSTIFDIYGVHIGDTPQSVDVSMENAGYELKPTSFADKEYQRSFEEQQQIQLGEAEPRDIAQTTPWKAQYVSDRGRFVVHFTAWPDGPAVTDAFFYPAAEFLDCDTFTAAANERYAQGIQTSQGWTDTADEPDGSTTVWVKCGSSSFSPQLHLFMRNARKIHTDLLSSTDPKPELDF